MKTKAKVAVIGAGPAGIIAAKKFQDHGIEPIIFEQQSEIGGIWNPASGGAYKNVVMQNSKYTFHFSDMKPKAEISDFPKLLEVFDYLKEYVLKHNLRKKIRFNTKVIKLCKVAKKWEIIADNSSEPITFDAVIVAIGELWKVKIPEFRGLKKSDIEITNSREYQSPELFKGKNVLVIGGGVSGADIASDLVGTANSISWSITSKKLFLPRWINEIHNDMRFSYIERLMISRKPYKEYLKEITELIPEYMNKYHKTGLVPDFSENNAVYVNEKIIPNVYAKNILPRTRIKEFHRGNLVEFTDGVKENFDSVIFCTGYEMPDYSFIQDFNIKDLYEHFIYYKDTTLGFVNPPVNTHGVGAAFPYFEVVSDWVVKTVLNYNVIPSTQIMKNWCMSNMNNLEHKQFYDAWLESIRLAQISGLIPTPEQDSNAFWRVTTSPTVPDIFDIDWQARNISKSNISNKFLLNPSLKEFCYGKGKL